MNIVDWRQVDARALALVFARERARWLVELWWETRESWAHIDHARSAWGLPGLAAVDDGGRVRGLTFFYTSRTRFDLGGLFAESAPVRQALLDAAIAVCGDAGAEQIAAFMYAGEARTAELLESRGFDIERVDYLSLDLDTARTARDSAASPAISIRDWRDGDVERCAELLHASYEGAPARRFVPDASVAGWASYVSNLVRHTACGRLLPAASRLAFSGEQLVGVVLATDLGPATAHLPQVAIHPGWRGRGLAGVLIDGAAGRLRESGLARVTLLVSATNTTGQALYRGRGFVEAATFLAANRRLSTRAGIVAPESVAS